MNFHDRRAFFSREQALMRANIAQDDRFGRMNSIIR